MGNKFGVDTALTTGVKFFPNGSPEITPTYALNSALIY
jgi:hypothetical protein